MKWTSHYKVSIWTRLAAAASVCAALSLSSMASAAVPTPVIKSSPAGTHGFPFQSSALNLAQSGFVEQEFLISGTANAYVTEGTLGTNGQWKAKPNPGVTSAYTTRLLVRRPTDPSRFNGTVVVEWLNVSGGFDTAPDWALISDELLREGYAWVGVTVQFVGALALQQWESGSADRYATIFHPGDSFAYDIYSQAAQAIRVPGGVKPLGSLTSRIRQVLADGESQSAGEMITYYNAIQPLAKVYDGFLIHSNGAGAPLSQSFAGFLPFSGQTLPPPDGVPATPDIRVPPTSFLRTDLSASVVFVNTESDLGDPLGGARSVHQQPDSQHFRMWEIAGTSHADQKLLASANADSAKSGMQQNLDCGNPPLNNGPDNYAMRAAVNALRVWAATGIAPSIGPRFSVTVPPAPQPVVLHRDPATGLVIGGIRLPQIAVPISTETGVRPGGAVSANPFCFLFGASDLWNGDTDAWDGQAGFDPSPTPEPVLSVLYPTHADYEFRVLDATVDALLRGFLRPADAGAIISQAEHAHVPQ